MSQTFTCQFSETLTFNETVNPFLSSLGISLPILVNVNFGAGFAALYGTVNNANVSPGAAFTTTIGDTIKLVDLRLVVIQAISSSPNLMGDGQLLYGTVVNSAIPFVAGNYVFWHLPNGVPIDPNTPTLQFDGQFNFLFVGAHA